MTIREVFAYRIFTLSNFLSLLRLFLLPPLWYLIREGKQNPKANMGAVFILIVMVITDFLDGFLARILGQETPLGQYLDPLADKLAILGGFLALVLYRSLPLWLFLFILVREIAGIWLGTYLLVKKNILGKPNWWGKFGVGFCAAAGLFYLLELPYREITVYLIAITFTGGIIAYAHTYWRTVWG
ncbi:MAG: CDP-alcohol phosphatidyltransferase family protein [Leptospiraceae bacterium]|nr:CDP-alcohol phosphatidyltransferase family protein [Leptospiraceae bacterium]MDW8307478.1 CDP-alcohol phosphatidyltransferase family protein [Leptospiraceae bacterium]